MKIHTNSPEETYNAAKNLAEHLNSGDVICLYGDLGAGKTLFAQGIASGLGVIDHVNSPTFTIVNEYEGRLPFYHFDVYRISDADEMYEIGFDEYLYSEGVCLIEWAELIPELLPSERINVTISGSGNERDITIESIGKETI